MEKLAKKLGIGIGRDNDSGVKHEAAYLEYDQVIQRKPDNRKVWARVIIRAKLKPNSPAPFHATVIIDGRTDGVTQISSDVSAVRMNDFVRAIRQATNQLLIRRCTSRKISPPKMFGCVR